MRRPERAKLSGAGFEVLLGFKCGDCKDSGPTTDEEEQAAVARSRPKGCESMFHRK